MRSTLGIQETSCDSAAASVREFSRVDKKILEHVGASGTRGVTQSEVVDAMPEYKPGSITPRFKRLEDRGEIVRVPDGLGRPSKEFPLGRPLYKTRWDEVTSRNVNVYWLPGFEPSPDEPISCESAGGGR
jgi:hypothetical protein